VSPDILGRAAAAHKPSAAADLPDGRDFLPRLARAAAYPEINFNHGSNTMTANERRRAAMLSGPIWPVLARMAAPGIVAMLITSLMSIVETWFLGQIGTVALAAVALVFPVFMLTNMLSAGSVGGVISGATANASGAGDDVQTAMILRAGFLMAGVCGVGMAVLFWLAGPAFYALLGGEGAVLDGAVRYSAILMLAVPLIWQFNMLAGVIRGAGDMGTPAMLQALVTASHAGFCQLYIVELELGVGGAGWAILSAYACGSAALVWLFAADRAPVPLRRGPVPRTLLTPLIRLSTMAGFQAVLTIVTVMLITGLVGQLGPVWLAGYGIGARLEFLMIPIIFGIGAALIAMVGANRGAGQRDRAAGIAWRGTLLASGIVGGIGLLSAAFPTAWASLYSDDPEVIAACAVYMTRVGPFYAFFALGLALYFASQAMQTLGVPVFGSLLRFAIIAGGGLVLSAFGMANPESVFLLVAAGMTAYGVVVAGGLRLISWRPGLQPA
jgi:putative MATE family efflux protein